MYRCCNFALYSITCLIGEGKITILGKGTGSSNNFRQTSLTRESTSRIYDGHICFIEIYRSHNRSRSWSMREIRNDSRQITSINSCNINACKILISHKVSKNYHRGNIIRKGFSENLSWSGSTSRNRSLNKSIRHQGHRHITIRQDIRMIIK
jgi:hypothetical protein